MKFYLWNLKVKSTGINGLKPSIRQLFYPEILFLVFGHEKIQASPFHLVYVTEGTPFEKMDHCSKNMIIRFQINDFIDSYNKTHSSIKIINIYSGRKLMHQCNKLNIRENDIEMVTKLRLDIWGNSRKN